MVAFPQHGHCLCRDVEYRLIEDPMSVYLCHCSDCQTQSGASFAISMIVRSEALETLHGRATEIRIEVEDGRVKRSFVCARCCTRLWGPTSVTGFSVLEPGTLDDTSWFHPVGHIWTRSAQPWFEMPEDSLVIEAQPDPDEILALVRAWKAQRTSD